MSDEGWEALLDLIETLNLNPQNLEDKLNIDRVLWAFAVNTVVSNLDTYNGYYVHNYYLYQDEQGRFQMIPWDLDNSFVGAIMGYSYWNPNEVYHFDPFFSSFDPAWDVSTGWRISCSIILNTESSIWHTQDHLIGVDGVRLGTRGGDNESLLSNLVMPRFSLFGTKILEQRAQCVLGRLGVCRNIMAPWNREVDFLSSHAEVDVLTPTISVVDQQQWSCSKSRSKTWTPQAWSCSGPTT